MPLPNNNQPLNNITRLDIERFSKPQVLRLWDVFFLGPMLILSGASAKKLHPLLRAGLVISGALTMTYNGRNWILNKKAETTSQIKMSGWRRAA